MDVAVDPLGKLSSFLVPVDGSDASDNALAITCDVARRKRASVTALYVIEVPRSLPLEAELEPEAERGEQILTRAEQIADAHDIQIEGALLQAREAGQALVDEAVQLGVDAIVVGLGFRHRPYGRPQLGRLPQYVLTNAPCQVWLIRQEPDEDGEAEQVGTG